MRQPESSKESESKLDRLGGWTACTYGVHLEEVTALGGWSYKR